MLEHTTNNHYLIHNFFYLILNLILNTGYTLTIDFFKPRWYNIPITYKKEFIMTKYDALKLFYENNNINPKTIHPRDRIADLPKKLDDWLQNIDSKDHPIFLDTFSKYIYLTQEECQDRFVQSVAMLKSELHKHNIEVDDVLYVTVESSGGTKSGSDNVRSDMQRYNLEDIGKDQILAAQSKFIEERLEGIQAIVFVDDLLGTGCTLWNEMYSFCEKFKINGNGKIKLYYMCIAPTEKGINHFNKNLIKHGYTVTSIYKNEWICAKAFMGDSPEYGVVNKYETEIDNYFTGSDHSYRMGFKQGCLLISFYYNTPNNTISSFWRPTPFNAPPFKRDGKECKRPSISDLTNKKKQSDANSYAFAVIRSE